MPALKINFGNSHRILGNTSPQKEAKYRELFLMDVTPFQDVSIFLLKLPRLLGKNSGGMAPRYFIHSFEFRLILLLDCKVELKRLRSELFAA